VIRLGTRRSPLALAQAGEIAERLRRLGDEVAIVPMRTEGDRLFDVQLARLGGKGLFVRDIEQALLDGAVDIAVHSLKDLPADVPRGLTLAAFPEREDPRDVLVTRDGGELDDLGAGAVIGTSSPRRRALVLSARPDLVVEPIRGNVETRLQKLQTGACDAIVLAMAGLRRLNLRPPHVSPLAPDTFVPAVGQGVLAIEARRDDDAVLRRVAPLDHGETRLCALAERAFLRRLGASCVSPMAAHATLEAASLELRAMVASDDGRQIVRGVASGAPDDAEAIGRGLAESLLERGAAAVTTLNPLRRGDAGG
jgi:hydroxymethylbilane synthase